MFFQKKKKVHKVILVGAMASGKTTLLAAMVQNSKYKLYVDENSKNCAEANKVVQELKDDYFSKGKWPNATGSVTDFFFERSGSKSGKTERIAILDYLGEAFEKVFGEKINEVPREFTDAILKQFRGGASILFMLLSYHQLLDRSKAAKLDNTYAWVIEECKKRNIPIYFLITCCDACKVLAWLKIKSNNEQHGNSSGLEKMLKDNYRAVADKIRKHNIPIIPISAVKTVYRREDNTVKRFPIPMKTKEASSVGVDEVLKLIFRSKEVNVPYETRVNVLDIKPGRPDSGNFVGTREKRAYVDDWPKTIYITILVISVWVVIFGILYTTGVLGSLWQLAVDLIKGGK